MNSTAEAKFASGSGPMLICTRPTLYLRPIDIPTATFGLDIKTQGAPGTAFGAWDSTTFSFAPQALFLIATPGTRAGVPYGSGYTTRPIPTDGIGLSRLPFERLLVENQNRRSNRRGPLAALVAHCRLRNVAGSHNLVGDA